MLDATVKKTLILLAGLVALFMAPLEANAQGAVANARFGAGFGCPAPKTWVMTNGVAVCGNSTPSDPISGMSGKTINVYGFNKGISGQILMQFVGGQSSISVYFAIGNVIGTTACVLSSTNRTCKNYADSAWYMSDFDGNTVYGDAQYWEPYLRANNQGPIATLVGPNFMRLMKVTLNADSSISIYEYGAGHGSDFSRSTVAAYYDSTVGMMSASFYAAAGTSASFQLTDYYKCGPNA